MRKYVVKNMVCEFEIRYKQKGILNGVINLHTSLHGKRGAKLY